MLDNQVAVVTGASRGIGRAVALALAAAGAVVIVNYNGSKEKAAAVVKAIEEQGGKAAAYRCNVADSAAVNAFLTDILARYGQIDILVNNAGITRDGLLMRMSDEDFAAVVNTNLTGAFNCSRTVAKAMLKKRRGRIINISSVSGLTGNAGQANYSASKAGIIGLTKAVARELASRGITVNAVAPGFIETDMANALPEKLRTDVLAQIPLAKFGQPEDVAEAVVFLASDKAKYITGQVLQVDGGMVM